jgi:hypothetical protein
VLSTPPRSMLRTDVSCIMRSLHHSCTIQKAGSRQFHCDVIDKNSRIEACFWKRSSAWWRLNPAGALFPIMVGKINNWVAVNVGPRHAARHIHTELRNTYPESASSMILLFVPSLSTIPSINCSPPRPTLLDLSIYPFALGEVCQT